MRNECRSSHGVTSRSPGARTQRRPATITRPGRMSIQGATSDGAGGLFSESDAGLVHNPSGCRVPVCQTLGALDDLARRLVWFPEVLDPDYLAAPSNADVRESLRALVKPWLNEPGESEEAGRTHVEQSTGSRVLWDVTA